MFDDFVVPFNVTDHVVPDGSPTSVKVTKYCVVIDILTVNEESTVNDCEGEIPVMTYLSVEEG